jgi:hypothetical protein
MPSAARKGGAQVAMPPHGQTTTGCSITQGSILDAPYRDGRPAHTYYA